MLSPMSPQQPSADPTTFPSTVRATMVAAALVLVATASLACVNRRPPTSQPPTASVAATDTFPPVGLPAGRLAITIGDHLIRGERWPGAELPDRALLRDAAGQAKGAAEVRSDGGEGWEARLEDEAGEATPLRPGDRLWLETGGERREVLRLPGLRLSFDRAADRLVLLPATEADGIRLRTIERTLDLPRGRFVLDPETGPDAPEVTPGTALTTATATDAPRTALPTTAARAGPAGAGAFPLDPQTIEGGQAVTLSLRSRAERWNLAWPRRAPYLRVSLHPGDITGNLEPGAAITLSLSGPADRAGRGIARAGDDGGFSTWLFAADGRRVKPRPGDTVLADDGVTRLEVTVPEFAVAWDLATERLTGRGPAAASLDFTVWNPWRPGETETPKSAVGPDGAWSLAPEHGLHPATHFYITTHLPDGDQLYHCEQVPMLYLEPGDGSGRDPRAAFVEVQTLWELRAELELRREDRVVARAAGGGPWSGNLGLILQGTDGAPMPIRTGDVVRASIGSQVLEAKVLPLTASWQGGERGLVVGNAPPGATVGLAEPESPFPDASTRGDADGTYSLSAAGLWSMSEDGEALPDGLPPMAPGAKGEVYSTLASGHNLRRSFRGPTVVAALSEPTVQGTLPRGDGFTVAVDRRGSPLADPSRMLLVGATGLFTAELAVDSATASLASGDRITVIALGRRRPLIDVTLPALSLVLDADGIVSGEAPAGALLDVELLTAAGEPPLRYAVTADRAGQWRLDALRPPAGQAIAPPDLVRRVDVVWRDQGLELRRSLSVPAAAR